MSGDQTLDFETISVAIAAICSAPQVERCLRALEIQENCPSFEVAVAYDPHLEGMDDLAARFPKVNFVANAGQRTPMELASRALAAAQGDLILLTEDHCVPATNWVREMVEAQRKGRAVVGGRIEIAPQATATDWAFYFVDFFRYAGPVETGPSPTLTVCNAAYKRAQLADVRDAWADIFHETGVNERLRDRFGSLWLCDRSEVTMERHVGLRDALFERYQFGRLFSSTRIRYVSGGKRLFYALFSPLLPVLLMGRMGGKALSSPRLLRRFVAALLPLVGMTLCWSWGEWLGYLTGGPPGSAVETSEVREAKRLS